MQGLLDGYAYAIGVVAFTLCGVLFGLGVLVGWFIWG